MLGLLCKPLIDVPSPNVHRTESEALSGVLVFVNFIRNGIKGSGCEVKLATSVQGSVITMVLQMILMQGALIVPGCFLTVKQTV